MQAVEYRGTTTWCDGSMPLIFWTERLDRADATRALEKAAPRLDRVLPGAAVER